jgi:N-acetylneuraminate synthase/N,N'-diacetyllegionaminate synthase
MLRRLVLPREAVERVARHAAERGLVFLSTPFDHISADFLEELGVAAFKVPSGEVTNHGFLIHIARKGRPVLMSTGMSTLEEVSTAVHLLRAHGDPPLALFHCVTNYPAEPAECNLRAMETLREAFGVPVGWSDHTPGTTIALAAVARGAAILEKHFTLSRRLPGPDHAASLEPDELASLAQAARQVEAALGDGVKRPTTSELEIRPIVRRGLHLRHDLPAGRTLTCDDLVAVRPASGIPSERLQMVIGRTLRVAVRRGRCLWEEDLE